MWVQWDISFVTHSGSSTSEAEKSHQHVSIQILVGDSSRGTVNSQSIKSGRPPDYLSRGHRQSTDHPSPPIRWGGCKDIWRNGIPSCPAVLPPKKIMNEEGEDIFLF
ncbi:hypothetical protein CEXT_494301 [Caerostris extrusa]|uniref:Uncharacterized protein n=1 Tax=Caerostris extrusa TaxID=172846 RepID=A0AAV4YFP7_CAEEX|nr:hypothetical protein CEXT_494301 [Caerostris extrusa]